MGIEPKSNHRIYREGDPELSENQAQSMESSSKPDLPFGWINDQYQLCFSDLDIHKIN